MEQNTLNKSRLMRISWDIQKRRRNTRSKAMIAAWAIFSNEDVTILHLTRKLNRNNPVPTRVANRYTLFAH